MFIWLVSHITSTFFLHKQDETIKRSFSKECERCQIRSHSVLFFLLCVCFCLELLECQMSDGGVCSGPSGSRAKCSDQVQISTLGSHLLTGVYITQMSFYLLIYDLLTLRNDIWNVYSKGFWNRWASVLFGTQHSLKNNSGIK